MKKLFLLTACAFAALSSFAQDAKPSVPSSTMRNSILADKVETAPVKSSGTLKTTATGTREYNHHAYNLQVSSFEADSIWYCRIWFDSTVKQTFGTGLGNVNYSSVAQVLYPMDSIFNDVANPAFNGKMRITSTNAYIVDSVKLTGLYVTGKTRPTSIVDTLIISLTSQPTNVAYRYAKTFLAGFGIDVTPYLTTADNDTFNVIMPLSIDSINRAAFAYTGTPTRRIWKELLTSSMRSDISAVPETEFTFAVNGGAFNVPAGQAVCATYTFKSGDTWTKNVSHIDTFHRFFAKFGGSRKIMPYKNKWNNPIRDRSHSSLMFSNDSNFYYASAFIEAMNSVSFFYEYLDAGFVVSCPTCGLVTGINETSIITNASAFPIPANNELNIPFTVKEKSNVTISVSNLLGQVVATQNMSNVNAGQSNTAVFNTANLVNGVYIYTIEANGQRASSRFSVAH